MSEYTVNAGNGLGLMAVIKRARARCGVSAEARVSCYEAGRDGWWLHRRLIEQGIDNIVVDSASIEVNRRAAAGQDRSARWRQAAGDAAAPPCRRARLVGAARADAEDEDARRTHRELARLTARAHAHTNRIGSLLVLHNLRPHIIGGRDWAAWWERHGAQVPPVLRAEIERESARLALVKQQIKALEAARRQELEDGKQPLVAQLASCAPSDPRAPGCWSRSCSAGGASPTGASWPAAWGWRPRPTPAATARSSKASARPATSERERCWWSSPGAGCACSPTAR